MVEIGFRPPRQCGVVGRKGIVRRGWVCVRLCVFACLLVCLPLCLRPGGSVGIQTHIERI